MKPPSQGLCYLSLKLRICFFKRPFSSKSSPPSSHPPLSAFFAPLRRPPPSESLPDFPGRRFPAGRHRLWPSVNARISRIAHEILSLSSEPDISDVSTILESRSVASLLREFPDGSASLELMFHLRSRPLLALEVFNWRREQLGEASEEEHAKAITLAGRVGDLNRAAEIFLSGCANGVKSSSMYNALMGAYMYNGESKKALSVYEDLRVDEDCGGPTIASYNILISVFSRLMLVDHMEAVVQSIREAGLSLSRITYNVLIRGYITAWMWEEMERTFNAMGEAGIRPDLQTHLLMLRGYAHSGNIEKMEMTYRLVKKHVDVNDIHLIRTMICSYCKSVDPEKIRKIEALMALIPKEDYRPWLNVLLIRVYAQEGLMEGMEELIQEALDHNTVVVAMGVMRAIVSGYYHNDAVDRLAAFTRQAEAARWRMCRSLYHCQMVMYAVQDRFEDMHGVLMQMDRLNLWRVKRTYVIMYKAYMKAGMRWHVERVIGTLWKLGHDVPQDAPLLCES
ncbi:Pentatricopeptide repeat-containing protein [Acorus calamus]|uniref:Pentatricopeptide repeat-containing protein n=1 Tax=Acorus calamus TaxID=4465 RepID=A0AAV9EUH2_ACOCL|nr:Pentatricopeptide repeat-containing protein [Acorus calamus]